MGNTIKKEMNTGTPSRRIHISTSIMKDETGVARMTERSGDSSVSTARTRTHTAASKTPSSTAAP